MSVVGLGPLGEPTEPEFLPDWSPAFLRERAYVSGLCLFAPSLAGTAMAGLDIHAPGFGHSALLRAAEMLRHAEVSHLPRLALMRGAKADRPYAIPPTLLRATAAKAGSARISVSIVMPTRDRVDLLRPAVESLLNRTAPADFDLIVADNGSADPAALAYLDKIDGIRRTRVLRVGGPFNFSRIVNAGAAAGAGEVILLLNNDVEIVSPDWLSEMLACFDRPDVGAVGAKLLYPDGTVQHAGTVVGWGGHAGHFGRRMAAETPGHLGRQLIRHEVSAVTAACLAVRRRHFEAVGGFDESFAVAFNDVDFCLRLRERGLRNLVAPRAVLIHHESASRGEDRGRRRARFREERARFGERWRVVIQDDPYFHVALSLNRNCEMLE